MPAGSRHAPDAPVEQPLVQQPVRPGEGDRMLHEYPVPPAALQRRQRRNVGRVTLS